MRSHAPPGGLPASQQAFVLGASFVSGALILVLEILGTRVISPYYGSSIYVWSSLITVTLASLTLGYWLGGMAADRWPSLVCFSVALLAGGLFTLAIPALRTAVLLLSTPLGLRLGSLASATLLFVLPLVALSMTGPVAIRLVTSEFTVLGRGVGKIYGVSTLGSMLGAVATGFYLIPSFSVRANLLGVAVALLVVGSIGLWLARRRTGALGALAIAGGVALVLAGNEALRETNVLRIENSFYGELKVVDAQDRRMLLINGANNGQVDRDTKETRSPNVQDVIRLRHLNPGARRALVIGLGAGGLPSAFTRHHGIVTDVVEIDPAIVGIARDYFGFTTRGTVAIEDGRTFVERTNQRYDFVFLDAFASEVQPFHLFTREFFAQVRAILNPGGVLAINTVAYPYGPGAIAWKSLLRTLHTAFPRVRVFTTEKMSDGQTDRYINMVFAASDGALSENGASPAARTELEPLLQRELVLSGAEANEGILLTDDYNPIEALCRGLFVAWRKDLIESAGEVLLFDGRS